MHLLAMAECVFIFEHKSVKYCLKYLLSEKQEKDGASADHHGLHIGECQMRVNVQNSLQILEFISSRILTL